MKQKIRKLQLLFYISLAGLLLFSCNMEDDSLNTLNSTTKFEQKSYAELIKTEIFSSAMNLIPKKIQKASKGLDRTMMEDKYAFTMYDTPINVMEKIL